MVQRGAIKIRLECNSAIRSKNAKLPPLSAKRKNNSSKEKWQAKRAPYTWHLRPPFDLEFDRTHWWKGKPEGKIKSIVCLYELARRHPRIGQLRLKFHRASWYGQELRDILVGAKNIGINSKVDDDLGQESEAIKCLCQIGLKSWVNLPWFCRNYWMASAGNLKGVDERSSDDRCFPITLKTLAHLNEKSTTDELEKEIVINALRMHRQGHLVFSFAPDLKTDTAVEMFKYQYVILKKFLTKKGLQRERHENWLPIISEFEENTDNSIRVKKHQFTKYKRAVDGIRFQFHNLLNEIIVHRTEGGS